MSATQEHVASAPVARLDEIGLNGSKDLPRHLNVQCSHGNITARVRLQLRKRKGVMIAATYQSLAYASARADKCSIFASKTTGAKVLYIDTAAFPVTDKEAAQLIEHFGFKEGRT